MANLTTTSDLQTYVLEGMGELTDGTSEFASKVVTQLVRCNRGLHVGGFGLHPDIRRPVIFPWALSQYPLVVNFEASIDAGTLVATKGSTTIAFWTAPTVRVENWYVKVRSSGEVYRIVTHTAPGNSGALIDKAYVGESTTDAAYDCFKLRYDFGADVLMPVSPIRIFYNNLYEPREIDVVDRRAMERDWPKSMIRKDFPSEAAIVYDDGEGTVTFEFNAYPSDAERMEMDYIREPPVLALEILSPATPAVDPVMPLHQRITIAEWALFYMLRDVDDDRAAGQLQIARAQLDAMIAEAQGQQRGGARSVGRIIPRPGQTQEHRRILRTADGFIIG